MPNKSTKSFTAKAIAKKIESREMTFDNIIQRNLVWDKNRKSLFIHSLICGWMPVPPIYCIKGEKSLDVIDGQQRLTTIPAFLKDEFVLSGVPEFDDDGNPFTTEDGTLIGDINGKKFSELPEEFQDNIKDYMFSVQSFEDIPSALVAEIFMRINNGKPLSAVELAWVKCKSKAQLTEIVSNPLFATILSESAINKYADIKIAMFAWAALFQPSEEVSFESKKFRPLMAISEMTDEQVATIMDVLTYIKSAYEIILTKDGTDEEKSKYAKIAKKVATQTHLLSILQIAKQSVENNVPAETFANWCLHFFTAMQGVSSISSIYNDNSYSATNNNASINKRLKVVNLDYMAFIRNAPIPTPTVVEQPQDDHEEIHEDEHEEVNEGDVIVTNDEQQTPPQDEQPQDGEQIA